MADEVVLKTEGLTKYYGGLHALDGANFELRCGRPLFRGPSYGIYHSLTKVRITSRQVGFPGRTSNLSFNTR